MKYQVKAYKNGKVVDFVLCVTYEQAVIIAADWERTREVVTEIAGHFDTRIGVAERT